MQPMTNTQTSDFSKGSVSSNILRLALPMTVAQLINVLYSVVDRMYIGHLPNAAADACTGIGLTFPIISIVTAFANLFGMGGSPHVLHRAGPGPPGQGPADYGQHLFPAGGHRRGADGGDPAHQKAPCSTPLAPAT